MVCNSYQRSRDLRKVEDEKKIGNAYSHFYSLTGCFTCDGEDKECIRYGEDIPPKKHYMNGTVREKK